MTLLFTIIATLVALYLGFGVLYQFFYSVAGHLPQPQFAKPAATNDKAGLRKFAVFIAAYKEDGVIYKSAKRALQQRYPRDLYEVFIMSDQLRPSTLRELIKLDGARTLLVCEETSTKSKGLRAGLQATRGSGFDAVVVLDADNDMAPDFLLEANAALAAGFRAVQGQRTAPPGGLNATAKWDAISEAINNHILCSGHHALGMSARLAGSGMAFEYNTFRDVMQDVHAIGGFDKELELRLTKAGESIAYAKNAIVYDEKVASAEVFAKQRGRWLAAQYTYAKRFIPGACVDLFRGNVDHFNKAMQMALPPRLLLPVGLIAGMVLSLPVSFAWSGVFAILFCLNVSTFALAIPPAMWRGTGWMLATKLPALVWSAVKAVVSIPASAKTFYHTPHTEVALVKSDATDPQPSPVVQS